MQRNGRRRQGKQSRVSLVLVLVIESEAIAKAIRAVQKLVVMTVMVMVMMIGVTTFTPNCFGSGFPACVGLFFFFHHLCEI